MPPTPAVVLLVVCAELLALVVALAVVPPPPVVAGVDPPHATAVSASIVQPRFVPLMRPMVPSSRSPAYTAAPAYAAAQSMDRADCSVPG
jgi:hypothetical protein